MVDSCPCQAVARGALASCIVRLFRVVWRVALARDRMCVSCVLPRLGRAQREKCRMLVQRTWDGHFASSGPPTQSSFRFPEGQASRHSAASLDSSRFFCPCASRSNGMSESVRHVKTSMWSRSLSAHPLLCDGVFGLLSKSELRRRARGILEDPYFSFPVVGPRKCRRQKT